MVRNLLRINILVSLLFLCLSVSSQVTIRGVITDFDLRINIDSAHIILEIPNGSPLPIEAYTDTLGKYTITIPFTVPEGNYPISIRKPGFYDLSGIVFIKPEAERNFFLRNRSVAILAPKPKVEPKPKELIKPAPVEKPMPVDAVEKVVEDPAVVEADKQAEEKAKQAEEQKRLKEEYLKQQQAKAAEEEKEKQKLAKETVVAPKPDDAIFMPIKEGAVVRVDKIYFNANATFLRPDSYAEMDRIVAFLKSNPNIKVEIGGHTNGLCDDDFCMYLSEGRAKAVKEYLLSKGIPGEMVSHVGYGKKFPIADNNTSDGRVLNQRVEMKIIEVQ